MNPAPANDQTMTIGFLLMPLFSMMAFVSAIEPLRVANRMADRQLYRWEVLSRDGNPVTASNNMSLAADHSIARHPPYPMVAICASFNPLRHFDAALKQWLQRQNAAGVELGAMDTGAFLLARAGLLDGYRATTHWESLDSFAEAFPKVEVENALYVIDRNRWSCAGGTASLDLMLHMIRRQHGHRIAAAVSEQFIHPEIRGPGDRQRMEPKERQGINHAGLSRVIQLMESRLEEPVMSAALAKAAGMSLRQLERLFDRYFGMSPRRYYLDLRLQRARSMLQYTDMSIVEVAVACGFGSAAHFSRSYHAWAGKAPSAERRRPALGIMPALR
ncbi:GlxA family transcriptional regulator [Dongia sp.]|uniref:GlxA family transcriptional regulator n=1 Tax=Dongia sp. TaxID=1977262 RepID=UPI0035AFD518